MISETTIAEVNNRLDALAVVGDYVRLEKRGADYWGCCPFHNEKTPSFKVDPDRKLYYCFGCHAGGGIIKFIMEMDKLTYPEAIETLARRFGVEIVRDNHGAPSTDDKARVRREEYFELYRRVAGSFHHILLNKPEGRAALDYLKARGVSDEIIERFRLGYSPANGYWLHHFLSSKGYSEAFLAESGLFYKKNPHFAFFSNRLMFPIVARDGKTQAFGARILVGDGPKYLNSSESSLYKKGETLFAIDLALPEIRRTKAVYIVEGYMDVIAMHQAGLSNTVAPLGTAFTAEQARLLARWAERVTLIFDSDVAGKEAAVKGILTARRAGLACYVVRGALDGASLGSQPPTLKDPADILKENGADALTKFAENAIIDFDFLTALSNIVYDITTPQGQVRAAIFLFPFLETVESELERQRHIRDLADALGGDVEAVTRDFQAWVANGGSGPERNAKAQEAGEAKWQGPVQMNDELYLLTAVFVNLEERPDLAVRLRKSFRTEDFEDENARDLSIAMEEWRRGGIAGTDELLSRIRNARLRDFVTQKAASGIFSENVEQCVDDSIKRLRRKRLERERSALVGRMRLAKNGGQKMDELMAEKVSLDEAITELGDQ